MAETTDYWPLGLYEDPNKPSSRPPVQKHERKMVEDNQTVIEILEDDLVINPTSLVFINGFLISKQEYVISENVLTLNTAVNKDDVVTIVK